MMLYDLKAAALALPEDARAALARELIDSLDFGGEVLDGEAWTEAWGAEIATRLSDYEATGIAVPHHQMLADARAHLEAMRR